jgi:hypothetical protein
VKTKTTKKKTMEFIAEAVHASIDLTQTDYHDTVNDFSSPRASSPVPTPVDHSHTDHDSYPTAFYRPENVQQQPEVLPSHHAAPPLVSPIKCLSISLEKIILFS